MKKPAFSLITAIVFIILVSVVGVTTLNSSKSTLSFASRAYIKEQIEFLMDGARAKALATWLAAGNPADKKDIFQNGDQTREYFYPSKSDPKYKIKIIYKKINADKAILFDKNLVLARIIIETGDELSKIARIRQVRDYTISN